MYTHVCISNEQVTTSTRMLFNLMYVQVTYHSIIYIPIWHGMNRDIFDFTQKYKL
jgi:hypothetical protein